MAEASVFQTVAIILFSQEQTSDMVRKAKAKKIGPRMASGKFHSRPKYAKNVPYKSRAGYRAIASNHPINRMKRQLKG